MREKLIPHAISTKIMTPTRVKPPPPPTPIADLLKSNHTRFSIELCPGKDFDLDLLKKLRPKFCSVTWHSAYNANCDVDDIASISLAENLRGHGFEVMLHLAGRHLKRDRAFEILQKAKDIGIKDLLVLRGDEYPNLENGDFKYASDLMKFAKDQFSNYFSLGVAAYPEQSEDNIKYLIEKVSLGANYIVTNGSLNPASYKCFIEDCRRNNMRVPIIPGVFIISSFNVLMNVSKFCNIPIPEEVQLSAEKYKDKEEAFQDFQLVNTTNILKEIFESGVCDCIQLFSLNNLKLVEQVLENCSLLNHNK